MSSGRKPDYRLKVMSADGQTKCTIGAAWLDADGAISITLNDCVVLEQQQWKNIRLFPITPFPNDP